jgi:hypothetical protein
MTTVHDWTNEQLDLAIADAYVPRIPGQVSLMREAFVELRAARARIAELEAKQAEMAQMVRVAEQGEKEAVDAAEQTEAERDAALKELARYKRGCRCEL